MTEKACRHCHEDVVQQMDGGITAHGAREQVSCLRCHTSVGHMEMGATDNPSWIARSMK